MQYLFWSWCSLGMFCSVQFLSQSIVDMRAFIAITFLALMSVWFVTHVFLKNLIHVSVGDLSWYCCCFCILLRPTSPHQLLSSQSDFCLKNLWYCRAHNINMMQVYVHFTIPLMSKYFVLCCYRVVMLYGIRSYPLSNNIPLTEIPVVKSPPE